MKAKNIIYLIILFISAISQAQIDTLYQGDSVLIKGMTTNKLSYKINNLDNDGYWSKLGNYYVKYDDNLNILDTINLDLNFEIKYANKLFTITNYYHIEYDTIDSIILTHPHAISDSFYFISYDIDRRILSYKKINDSLIGGNYKFTYLKSKELFAVASIPFNNYYSTDDDSTNLKLTLIDTSGNVISNKTIERMAQNVSLVEQGNNILVGVPLLGESPRIYYIDNTSLEIVDSILYSEYFAYFKTINDSIIIGAGSTDYFQIYNTLSKSTNHLYYSRPNITISNDLMFEDLIHVNDWNIEGNNQDSIVFCYRICNSSNTTLGIEIDNFNINGTFNYRYVFNDFESNYFKSIHGVTYTNDGGVILTINGWGGSNQWINAYLLKFYPNGTSNIVSINPDKVVIIAYPNPTKDFINLSSSSLIKEIQVYNTLGQEVYSSKTNNKYKQIDVSNFSKGNYIAKIHTDNGDVTKKFIVE